MISGFLKPTRSSAASIKGCTEPKTSQPSPQGRSISRRLGGSGRPFFTSRIASRLPVRCQFGPCVRCSFFSVALIDKSQLLVNPARFLYLFQEYSIHLVALLFISQRDYDCGELTDDAVSWLYQSTDASLGGMRATQVV